MASGDAPPLYKGLYCSYKNLPNGSVLARRRTDGETAVGHPFARPKELLQLEAMWGTRDLTAQPVGLAAASVLNHENLVSLHTEMREWPLRPTKTAGNTGVERFLIWDFCDGGRLAALLDDPPVQSSDRGFLPESLVWHVLLGVLRALQWLHEGVRDTYGYDIVPDGGGGKRLKRIRGTLKPEEGWMPILHTMIRKESILFQQPRGIETYGQVKLGDFTGVVVLGHLDALANPEVPLVGLKSPHPWRLDDAIKGMDAWDSIFENEGQVAAQKAVPPYSRPIYPGTDVFDLGCVLFHMMTGREVPGEQGYNGEPDTKGEECTRCGCNHAIDSDLPRCVHSDCFPDIDIPATLDNLYEYTPALRTLVKNMACMKRNPHVRASVLLNEAWEGFESWARYTPDGLMYRDLFDDLYFREMNKARRDKEMAKAKAKK